MFKIFHFGNNYFLLTLCIGVIHCTAIEWQHCSNRSYYFGTSLQTYNSSLQYCESHYGGLANFGASPAGFIEELSNSCPKLSFQDGQNYWLMKLHKRQGHCETVLKLGGHFKFTNKSCSSTEFAICESLGTSAVTSNSSLKGLEWVTFQSVEYSISRIQVAYNNCVEYCTNSRSYLARYVSNDPTILLKQRLDINKTYWVNVSETLNTATDSFMCRLLMTCPKSECPLTGFAPFTFNCTQKAYCICERELLTVNKNTDELWVKRSIGHNEFFIVYEKKNYNESQSICRSKFNASMVVFKSMLEYFHIVPRLDLRGDSYWIKDRDTLDESMHMDSCLLYNKNNLTISSTPCNSYQYGICIRSSGDNSTSHDFKNDKIFVELLQDMKIDIKQTSKHKRKKNSADDKRQSSNALGVISAMILCAIVLIIVLSDLSNLKMKP